MKNCLIISILAATTTFGACYYDVEEELYPVTDCSTQGIAYNSFVKPLIDAKCQGCHTAAVNSGNITLEGYASTKANALNGKLVGSVKHSAGFSPMPKGGAMLVDCDIQKLAAWVEAGAPE